jgi:hypothetical protein
MPRACGACCCSIPAPPGGHSPNNVFDFGLTQKQVARRLRAYAAFVSKVESGEHRLDVVELAALCGVHGVDLADFLREAGPCRP